VFTIALTTIGLAIVVISIFSTSEVLALVGVGLCFWGGLLLYMTPARHVPLTLLNAAAISPTTNIERILSEMNLTEKGQYLPPTYLKNFESSVVFVPKHPMHPTPKNTETAEERLFAPNMKGIFLTPPGLAFSKLLERELGVSFTKTDLSFVKQKLTKLLVEELELADTAELQIQDDTITLELSGNVLSEICAETADFLPRTHSQLGCILSSAIACVLAKASSKIITIQNEQPNFGNKTTKIKYYMMDE
jgi:hypothetical protein